MKKFFCLFMAVLLTACTAQPQQAENSKNYTLLTTSDSDYAFTENGVYETLDHMDGTSDILFTDTATGNRSLVGEMTIDTASSCGNNGIFVLEDYIYFTLSGDGTKTPAERDNTTIFKYSLDGKLIEKHSFDKSFRPWLYRVVSDGKDLYFVASQYSDTTDWKSADVGLYRLDTDTFEAERLCDADFSIIGAWKNQIIAGTTRRTEDSYTCYIKAIDMTSYEQKQLFETQRLWWKMTDGKMYNDMEIPGSLRVYDIDTDEFTEIKLFDYDPVDVKNYRTNYYENDRYLFFNVARTDNYIETGYVYNLDTGEITQTGMNMYIFGKAGDYYLVTRGDKIISIGSAGYERIDNNFAFISQNDYISGNENFIDVTSTIDYR